MHPNRERVEATRPITVAAIDEPTPTEPREISPIAGFGIPEDELYYQAKGDASVLVEAWRKLDIERHPQMKAARKFVLEEWEKRTELHGQHDTPEVFLRHGDFFEVLVSIKYSVDAVSNPNAMLSLLLPGTMEPAWCTVSAKSTATRIRTEDLRRVEATS